MDVSVIIVNYNTKQLTIDCVDSIFKMTHGLSFEVILIDNASADGSVEHFRKDDRIVFVESEINLGFGKANNMGISIATGKYLFFLNSDTVLINNAINNLFSFIETKNELRIGVLGSILLDENKQKSQSFDQFHSVSSMLDNFLRRMNIIRGFEIKKYREIEHNGYTQVDYVNGADMFIPKSVLDITGGFDPNIFMFFEETDLQKRIANAGYCRIVINKRDIIHLIGGSFENKISFGRYDLMQKSGNYYFKKHLKGIKYLGFKIGMAFVILKDIYVYYYSFSFQEKKQIMINYIKNKKE